MKEDQPLYGHMEDFQAFVDMIEKVKFVRLGTKSIAVHQITAFYPEQRKLSDAELTANLLNFNPDKK